MTTFAHPFVRALASAALALGTFMQGSAGLNRICGASASGREELRECVRAHTKGFSPACRDALPGR